MTNGRQVTAIFRGFTVSQHCVEPEATKVMLVSEARHHSGGLGPLTWGATSNSWWLAWTLCGTAVAIGTEVMGPASFE